MRRICGMTLAVLLALSLFLASAIYAAEEIDNDELIIQNAESEVRDEEPDHQLPGEAEGEQDGGATENLGAAIGTGEDPLDQNGVDNPEPVEQNNVGPDAPENTNIVYSSEELADWCAAHEDTGGTVRLGRAVTLTTIISNYNGNLITIDTGPYGLIYNGGSLGPFGFEIIGEGVDMPVVDVYNVGGWRMHWLQAVQSLRVMAAGRDGVGGIALRISRGDDYGVNLDYIQSEGCIRSYGAGAVGLYLAVNEDTYCLNIAVEGDGAAAVYTEADANLYYCKLAANGARAVAVAGNGGVTLDACVTSPAPDNARVISRHITELVGKRLYLPAQQNERIPHALLAGLNQLTFLLSGGDAEPLRQSFTIEWSADLADLDSGDLGRIVINGQLLPPFQGLGLECSFPLELTIDVRDPHIPCISGLAFHDDKGNGPYAALCFWQKYDPADESVILWRSDNGGESWYDFTDAPELEWVGDWLYYHYGELTVPVMLQLEVLGAGESNVVTLYTTDEGVGGDIGGDRIGTDRNTARNGGEPDDNMSEGEDTDTDSGSDAGNAGGTHPAGTYEIGGGNYTDSDNGEGGPQSGSDGGKGDGLESGANSDSDNTGSDGGGIIGLLPDHNSAINVLLDATPIAGESNMEKPDASGNRDAEASISFDEAIHAATRMEQDATPKAVPGGEYLTALPIAAQNAALLDIPAEILPAPPFNTRLAMTLVACVGALFFGALLVLKLMKLKAKR